MQPHPDPAGIASYHQLRLQQPPILTNNSIQYVIVDMLFWICNTFLLVMALTRRDGGPRPRPASSVSIRDSSVQRPAISSNMYTSVHVAPSDTLNSHNLDSLSTKEPLPRQSAGEGVKKDNDGKASPANPSSFHPPLNVDHFCSLFQIHHSPHPIACDPDVRPETRRRCGSPQHVIEEPVAIRDIP